MDDWVWVESSGTSLAEEPRVVTSRFGDGYEQAAPDGLNPIDQVWQLQFTDVDDAIADEMIAFLRARNGAAKFNYVPLWATAPIRVVCRKWQRTLGSAVGQSSLTATFEQRFSP